MLLKFDAITANGDPKKVRGGRHCREHAGGKVEVDGTHAKERS